MRKTTMPQGLKTNGSPVITCSSEPISRRLSNGMILTAFSELAEQDLNPLSVIDALEREWRNK